MYLTTSRISVMFPQVLGGVITVEIFSTNLIYNLTGHPAHNNLDLSESDDGSDEANPGQRSHSQFVDIGAILLDS